jgi:RhtB (resistance to homoserine/threonine) family protein
MKELLVVAGVHWLAVMSPGPDFAMVMRNSLVYSRRTGILAAVGLAMGILLHVSYSLLGIGLIISKSIVLFNTIKLLGAAYLIYIGIKSLLAKKSDNPQTLDSSETKSKQNDLGTFDAIKMGFLTNALNPKATIFFLALFTQVISPSTPTALKMVYGLEMSVATFVWFAVVALFLTQKRVNSAFSGIRHYVEKAFGVILITLGIKVATGAQK